MTWNPADTTPQRRAVSAPEADASEAQAMPLMLPTVAEALSWGEDEPVMQRMPLELREELRGLGIISDAEWVHWRRRCTRDIMAV